MVGFTPRGLWVIAVLLALLLGVWAGRWSAQREASHKVPICIVCREPIDAVEATHENCDLKPAPVPEVSGPPEADGAH